MPSQTAIQALILNASYKIATLETTNLARINRGKLPIGEDLLNYIQLNLSGLTYQYDNTLYSTGTTVTLYNRLNGLIGIPQDATIDPNFQNPSIIIVESGSGVAPIEFVIPSGTSIPYNYAYTASAQPSISFLIPDGVGGLTDLGTQGMYYKLNGGVLSIWGNDAGDGTFEEDTYVRVDG